MFHRGTLRRRPLLRRRLVRRPPLPPGVRQVLARANTLMAEGGFAEAADIFSRLAQEAEQHGALIRAAELSIQSSRAHLGAGEVEPALARATEALRLFVRGGRPGRVPGVLSRMVATLRREGYESWADQLDQAATHALAEIGLSLDEARRQAPHAAELHGSLPARCEGCGAPLVPDEVEWHDAHTAECIYCGTVVKAG